MNKKKDIIIHPWEIFNIKSLAIRLNCSTGTVRNFMNDGLKHRKMKSITTFTGQQVLNYFNQETCFYTEKTVNKVFEKTGVKLAR